MILRHFSKTDCFFDTQLSYLVNETHFPLGNQRVEPVTLSLIFCFYILLCQIKCMCGISSPVQLNLWFTIYLCFLFFFFFFSFNC